MILEAEGQVMRVGMTGLGSGRGYMARSWGKKKREGGMEGTASVGEQSL